MAAESHFQFNNNQNHTLTENLSFYNNHLPRYDKIRLNPAYIPYPSQNQVTNSDVEDHVGKKFKINKRITYHSSFKRKTEVSSSFEHQNDSKSICSKRIINPLFFKDTPCVGTYDINTENIKKRIIKNIQMQLMKESKNHSLSSKKMDVVYEMNYNSIWPKKQIVDLSKQLSRKLQFMGKSKSKLSDYDEPSYPALKQKNLELQMPLNCSELDNLFKSIIQKHKVKISIKENSYL